MTGKAVLHVVKHSVGSQGRLGNCFWRSQKMRKILTSRVRELRVGRDLKGHLALSHPSGAWITSTLSLPSGHCETILWFFFSEEGYRIFFSGLRKKCHLRVGNPAILTGWSIWFWILSCNIFIFQFLVIYKFDMPAFCVSSMFLIKISGPGIDPCDTTYTNYPPESCLHESSSMDIVRLSHQ